MLNIWVKGFREDCISDPKTYFNLYKKKDWFNNDEVRRVIKEIDNTVAIKDEYMESPVFGAISPDRLSTGCKSVILLYVNPKCNVYASRCGDNCVPAIMRLAEREDVIITIHHPLLLPKDVKARFLDSNKVVTSGIEYIEEYERLRGNLK